MATVSSSISTDPFPYAHLPNFIDSESGRGSLIESIQSRANKVLVKENTEEYAAIRVGDVICVRNASGSRFILCTVTRFTHHSSFEDLVSQYGKGRVQSRRMRTCAQLITHLYALARGRVLREGCKAFSVIPLPNDQSETSSSANEDSMSEGSFSESSEVELIG